jgi:YD repeat-containing protein
MGKSGSSADGRIEVLGRGDNYTRCYRTRIGPRSQGRRFKTMEKSYVPFNQSDYTYDPITGNQASITTPEGKIDYTYNDVSDQLQETKTSTGSNDEFYYYNTLGELQDVYTLELNGTRYATFAGFNSSGLPTFSGGTPLRTAYTYDSVGNLQSVTDPNGMVTSYTYNSLNQLTGESVTAGSADLFTEHYDYYHNGMKEDEIDTRYVSNSTTVASMTTILWTYDEEGELLSETSSTTGGPASLDYTDSFTYDLDNNRLTETITGGTTGNGSVAYVYNGDDQLTTETGTYANTANNYQTLHTYDANGNLQTQVRTGAGAASDTYTYDLRNRMIIDETTTGSGTTYTDYSYDTNGVLTSETTNAGTSGAQTTYYLNDPNNLTGDTKAIQESTTLDGAPTRSYVLGTEMIAQSDTTNGVLYFLADGHGSTRALVNTSRAVVNGQVFDYNAFGDALDFTPASADTTWLFGGDGFYDPASGWTYQLARWRNGFWFTQMDPTSGDNQDPISLHKYLYANADPINGLDPSGHDELSDDAFALADDYVIEELAGLQTVENYIGSSVSQVFAGDQYDNAMLGLFTLTSIPGSSANLFQNPPPGLLSAVPVFGSILNGIYYAANGQSGWALAYAGQAAFEMITFGVGSAGEEAAELTEIAVIGRSEDVAELVGKPGFNILNDPNWFADPEGINDRWIQSVIQARQPVWLKSVPSLMDDSLLDVTDTEHFGTMFAREIDQLMEAGYQWARGPGGGMLFPSP